MGLFKKKNAPPVYADSIEILPEYFFKLDNKEYSLGMKFSELEGFEFMTSWQEYEKIKPKKTSRVFLKHKRTGHYLNIYVINRGHKKCKIQDAQILGIEMDFSNGIKELPQFEFFYKPGPKSILFYNNVIELSNILGEPMKKVDGKWTTEKREYLKDIEYIEYEELEFDYDYKLFEYKVRTTEEKSYDADVYEDAYYLWKKGDAIISATYDPMDCFTIKHLSIRLNK